MKIKVTEKDIKEGTPTESEACPVALAVKRCYPYNPYRHVVATFSFIKVDGVECPTPAPVRIFMEHFDEGLPVDPITFDLVEKDDDN